MSETQDQEKDLFDVSDIFRKKNHAVDTDAKEQEEKRPVEKVQETKKPEKEIVPDSHEEDGDDDDEDVKEKGAPKEKGVDHARELEKVQKTLKDTQRSFHEDRKKLTAYKKAVEKMKEAGTLMDEEATLLLDHIKYEGQPLDQEDEPVLNRYARVWDKEIEYMRKYSSNADDINSSIHAFQHLIQSCSAQERNDILDDLSQYEDDEVELTKQMIEMGRQYNDDIYENIREAGSIRKLKSVFAKNEQELQKKLDRLQKEYDKLKKKYEDYDTEPGSSRIPSGFGNNNLQKEEDAGFDVGKIFANRHKRR